MRAVSILALALVALSTASMPARAIVWTVMKIENTREPNELISQYTIGNTDTVSAFEFFLLVDCMNEKYQGYEWINEGFYDPKKPNYSFESVVNIVRNSSTGMNFDEIEKAAKELGAKKSFDKNNVLDTDKIVRLCRDFNYQAKGWSAQ